jgi:hypothetical protein
MPNPSAPQTTQDMANQHAQAVRAWQQYFEPKGNVIEPAISLLSVLANTLERLSHDQWAKCLHNMKLLDASSVKTVNTMLTMRHTPQDLSAMDIQADAKTLALFMSVLLVLSTNGDPDLNKLDKLTGWFVQPRGRLPRFVKSCWDGYFLFARQVAWRWEGLDPQKWPMDIPGVGVTRGGDATAWRVIGRHDLEDSSSPLWQELADEASGCLQTRYVWHEFQLPALWQGVDKAERGSEKFSAVKKNVKPVLTLRDLGWQRRKALAFPPPSINQTTTPAKTNGDRFFGLPGLLWAMGLDAGLRRNGRLQAIQQEFSAMQKFTQSMALNNMNEIDNFYSAVEVLPVVQTAVGGLQYSNKRFVEAQAVQRMSIEESSSFSLRVHDAKWLWHEDEGSHVLHIGDAPDWRLTKWKSGAFYALAGGRTMPVVLGIEGRSGAVEEWVWGTSEQWGLSEDGSSDFEVWPWVDGTHAFYQPSQQSIHVQDAVILDMSKFGNFRRNYFVLYVRVCWL